MRESITIEVKGRAYNRWVLRIWRRDPSGAFVVQTFVDWGPFWGQIRKRPDAALGATLTVSISPFDPDGNLVDAGAGYLLVELPKVQADLLDDTELLRAQFDVHGRNPAGAPEWLAGGTVVQRLANTESSS